MPKGSPKPKVALLLHGGTFSGPTDFDIQTPAKDASLMDYLARKGFDVFTLDIRGYGRSDKPKDGFSVTTEAGVRDLAAAIEAICALRGVDSLYLLGWSWGAAVAAIYATRKPERLRRLVLFAGGIGGKPLTPRPAPKSDWSTTKREDVMARIEQDVIISEAQEAFLKAALRWDQVTSLGPANEMFLNIAPAPDPEKIVTPTLIIYGARDVTYHPERVIGLFANLKTPDKSFILVPNAGHFLLIQKPRPRLFEAVSDFFGLS